MVRRGGEVVRRGGGVVRRGGKRLGRGGVVGRGVCEERESGEGWRDDLGEDGAQDAAFFPASSATDHPPPVIPISSFPLSSPSPHCMAWAVPEEKNMLAHCGTGYTVVMENWSRGTSYHASLGVAPPSFLLRICVYISIFMLTEHEYVNLFSLGISLLILFFSWN